MTFWELAIVAAGCVLTGQPVDSCLPGTIQTSGLVANAQTINPKFSGQAVDVELSAKAVLVWDISSGKVLHDKNATTQRPVASLSKLLSVLAVRDLLSATSSVVIPPEVSKIQRQGADIALPVGQHASVQDLLAASLIASANDAVVTLAVAAKGSESDFVDFANQFATQHGYLNTRLANSTGLAGGNQYSTAYDIKGLLTAAYRDPLLRPWLAQEKGVLVTQEGTRHAYKTTDQLLGTYLPILAAKTGYTPQAGENLAIMTEDGQGHKIGAVVLGSDDRFHDMKILVEWIWRNYTWH